MITRLIANLENVMSAVSVLNVGDLLIFENGQKALDLIKENIATFNASEITPLHIFTRGGTLAGNVMKKSTTSLSVEIKAMLLTDGSLILHRPEIKFFDKQKALDSLGKYLGIYNKDNDGNGVTNITIVNDLPKNDPSG